MILFLSRIHWQCSPEYALAGPRLALWPGVSLTLVAYSLNMFGDAVRDLLDPRPRGGRGKSSGAQVIFCLRELIFLYSCSLYSPRMRKRTLLPRSDPC